MRRLSLRLAIAVGLALAPCLLFSQPAAKPAGITAEEIVQRYIAARGGLEKLRAIRTLVFRGPPRPNGRPGRQILRARPFYLSIGSEGNDGSPWEAYDEFGLQPRVSDARPSSSSWRVIGRTPLISRISWIASRTASAVASA